MARWGVHGTLAAMWEYEYHKNVTDKLCVAWESLGTDGRSGTVYNLANFTFYSWPQLLTG